MESIRKLLPHERNKQVILIIIVVALALNVVTFALAYPEMFKPTSSTLEKDFSAYYNAGYRLYHNPSKVYVEGLIPGDYPFALRPQTFKYIPSFLLLMSPFLIIGYQEAFIAFNVLQLALMPLLGFFVYKLVENKNLALAILVCIVVLIDPLPSLPMTQTATNIIAYRFSSINPQTFSWSYYYGYACGNAHILQPVLLIAAMYFGFTKKPWLSGLMFALGAFDPRFGLLALPLIVWYNRATLLRFAESSAVFLTAMNLPFFFYHDIGFSLLQANANEFVLSQMYAYDWIPLYVTLALTVMEVFTLLSRADREPKTSIKTKLENAVSSFRTRLLNNRFFRRFARKNQN